MLQQHTASRHPTGHAPFRSCIHNRRPISRVKAAAAQQPQVIHQAQSEYNMVLVIEVPQDVAIPELAQLAGSRILQLDHSGNIHSLWRPAVQPTQSYWDILATLPGIAAPGPMAVLGLGAGTLSRLVNHLHPGQQMHGWELDPAVVMVGRTFMGMDDLEAQGVLVTHTGDALAEDAQQGCPAFTSMAVDLFLGGGILPDLCDRSTWRKLKSRVSQQPGSRIMVNLGHAPLLADIEQLMSTSMEGRLQRYRTLQALEAMLEVFGEGQVSVLITNNLDGGGDNSNCVAVTGPSEGLQEQWEAAVPDMLSYLKDQYRWQRCEDVIKIAA